VVGCVYVFVSNSMRHNQRPPDKYNKKSELMLMRRATASV